MDLNAETQRRRENPENDKLLPSHFAQREESAILRLLHAVYFDGGIAGQLCQGRGTQVA